jgi:hypothetical protein
MEASTDENITCIYYFNLFAGIEDASGLLFLAINADVMGAFTNVV